ncbi:MAG: bifunctional allantoicase/(S)-ureidoglycine aminohydrolase [Deltaproteobacteria bacterium]
MSYYVPQGGLPGQSERLYTSRMSDWWALIPANTQSDITTSVFPGWNATRGWVIARPLTGFAETFSQIIMEIAPGGGSDTPESDHRAECVVFVVGGALRLGLNGAVHDVGPGGYAYIAAGADWTIHNRGDENATVHWIRKVWEPAHGVEKPASFIVSDMTTPVAWMADTGEKWGTTRFVALDDLRHDMHVTIVTLRPGAVIPFAETHVMEHGLYVLQGRGRYMLNQDWVDVGPGDFMWLRAFCPQACEALPGEDFRYLLYKDVNRLPKLW